jgi:hypothetical protein
VTVQELLTESSGFIIQEDLTARPVQATADVHIKQTAIAACGVRQRVVLVQPLKSGQAEAAAPE